MRIIADHFRRYAHALRFALVYMGPRNSTELLKINTTKFQVEREPVYCKIYWLPGTFFLNELTTEHRKLNEKLVVKIKQVVVKNISRRTWQNRYLIVILFVIIHCNTYYASGMQFVIISSFKSFTGVVKWSVNFGLFGKYHVTFGAAVTQFI